MITLLFSFMLSVDTLIQTDSIPSTAVPDTLRHRAERVDTLKELEVHPDSTLPVMKAIEGSLKRQKDPAAPPSLNDILLKYAPGLHDRITHPFAIKERRRERKHKRDRKTMRHYDEVKTFDDLLREAIIREGLELPTSASPKTSPDSFKAGEAANENLSK